MVCVRRSVGSSVAVAILAGVPLMPLQAQSGPPQHVAESVVVTGSAQPVTFRELSRTVRVVTRDEIARLPAATVTDLIRLVASVDLRARGPRGVQVDFGVRGAGFGQVLVLVDGVRLNNAQTGHHNGDLPVTLDDIERVEVLLGPGSSAFGADAFGGTVNLITRRGAAAPRGSAVIGEHGLVDIGASGRFASTVIDQGLTGRVSRSSGFAYDREFRTTTVSSVTRVGSGTRISAGVVDKAFGANGFYGPSPSKEWTRLWSASAEHRVVSQDALDVTLLTSYRTHRDRFLWDVRRPGLFENTHRTHALDGAVRVRWRARPSIDVGAVAEVAGDWLRSSNLGRHALGRGAVAADLQWNARGNTSVQAALRADRYSTFGGAMSPAAGASHWLTPAWRLRASAGRAFRVPTFTERFYRDPAHHASSGLSPERAWAADAGVDWFPSTRWQMVAGVFRRWERGVIDWVRPDVGSLWRTANIRRVTVSGLEAGVRRSVERGPSVSLDYTWLQTDADALAMLSKYTLDYARHSVVASGHGRTPGRLDVGVRVEYRHRVGREAYALADVRVSRPLGRVRVFADVTNLFGVAYEEVRGVSMPGRWATVGVEVGRR